jgi:hypothetical protein
MAQPEKQTGDCLPEPNRPPGNNHKITDWKKFTEFANANGDKTQEQMAQLWEGDISKRTISRALAKNILMDKILKLQLS